MSSLSLGPRIVDPQGPEFSANLQENPLARSGAVEAVRGAGVEAAFGIADCHWDNPSATAALQARDIPAFGGAGNLNSLLGEKSSLFGRVGNFAGRASNHLVI
jgi:hypothetical protein